MQNTGNSACWGIARVYVDELGFVVVGGRRLGAPCARNGISMVGRGLAPAAYAPSRRGGNVGRFVNRPYKL